MYIEIDYNPTVEDLKCLIDDSRDQDELLDHMLETASIEGILPRLQEVIAEGNTAWLNELAFGVDPKRAAAMLAEIHSKPQLATIIRGLMAAYLDE